MRLGEKFGMPVISLIDTPGAFPGIGSEERHISEAIAVNLREMMRLRVPIIAAVIGEGGSGGALGIGVADRVLILENAYYSVISPEACSAILWRDRRHAAEAAEALKLTAQDLLKLEVVDEIIPEPEGGAHRDYDSIATNVAERCARLLSRCLRFRLPNYWRYGIKNFVGSVCSQAEKPSAPRRLDMMFWSGGKSAGVCWLAAVTIITVAHANAGATEFRFDRDTLAFANQTVFEYHEGHPSLRKPSTVRRDAYKRHCFVLCRTAMQFKKFARFDRRRSEERRVGKECRSRWGARE